MMVKMGIDLAMTVLLLCQMSYLLIGETAHEWMGTAMFVLFLLHHALNRDCKEDGFGWIQSCANRI